MRPIRYKDSYDPYELMMVPPYKKSEMIVEEIKKDKANLNLVHDLIILGADLEWQDEKDSNKTPLRHAIWKRNIEILKMLIDAGANINAQGDQGRSPLIWAAIGGKVEIVRLLIDAGADVNVQDDYGWTPLHWATEWENEETVQMLVDAGARKDIQDNYRRTPYDLAETEELKTILSPTLIDS